MAVKLKSKVGMAVSTSLHSIHTKVPEKKIVYYLCLIAFYLTSYGTATTNIAN